MPADDEMSIDERRKYLKRMEPRYRVGTKEQRGALLGGDGAGHGIASREPDPAPQWCEPGADIPPAAARHGVRGSRG